MGDWSDGWAKLDRVTGCGVPVDAASGERHGADKFGGGAAAGPSEVSKLLQQLQKESPENAAKLLDEAIAADPANFRLHSYRSLVASRYAAAGNLPEALKQAEQGCDALVAEN